MYPKRTFPVKTSKNELKVRKMLLVVLISSFFAFNKMNDMIKRRV